MRFMVLALVCLTSPAGARCVGPGDLASGVAFTREDGRTGLAVARDGGVFLNYDARSPVWTDQRQTILGLFERDIRWFPQDEPTMGGAEAHRVRHFQPALPRQVLPGLHVAGEVWEKVTTETQTDLGTLTDRYTYQADWQALEPLTVTIGGCAYAVIPVEATWTSTDPGAARFAFQRWLYFTDLGFAIETKTSQGRFGLTALAPAP